MANSRSLNPQQAKAPPPEKYGLPEKNLKAGLFRRFSVVMLLSGVFVLLKDVVFNWGAESWGESGTARAATVESADAENGNNEPPPLVLVETPEPIDQDALEPNPAPSFARASSAGAPIESFFSIEQPIFAEPVQARMISGLPLPAMNDNEPSRPVVGSDATELTPQVGGGAAGAGGGGGGGALAVASNSDGDAATIDPRLTGNRAPVVTGPARMNNLMVAQTVVIAAASLLQNASDADGDILSIQNLVASSGTLVDMSDGTWSYTPDSTDTTEVQFTYEVTDGTDSTPQTAMLDLRQLPDKTIEGTDAPDTIIGTDSHDVVAAGGGDDTVIAREGNDVIYGGEGNDRILAGDGDDVIFGGAGDDAIFGGGGDDWVFAGDGDDTIFGGDGNDFILGENGQDLIFGGAGDDILDGGEGNDQFTATVMDGNDSYSGGTGVDTYDLSETEADAIVDLAAGTASSAQTGSDSLSDIENVIGGSGNDTIVGSDDNNVIQGGRGSDEIDGGDGDDRFIATISDGDDSYTGGGGLDTYDLSGTSAGVVVDLGIGQANGAEIGSDSLSGIENVIGGSGDDVFKANDFFNVFTGGEGNDTFAFSGVLDASAVRSVRDQITDFQVGDKIDLSGFETNWILDETPNLELVVDTLEFSDSGKVRFRFESLNDGGESTIVEGRINQDGEYDLSIELNGRHNLTIDDFIGVS